MKRNCMPLAVLASGIIAALVAPAAARPQSVSLANGAIEIFDSDGDSAVVIDNGADLTAGGDGRTASLDLRSSNGSTTLSFNAFQAQLILGGGTFEGILLLKDSDGVTTTIDLDGLTGAVRLGGNDEDGDLIVYDSSDTETVRINGESGTATNALEGNGLIKAWAEIDSTGSVVDCWRCDSSATVGLDLGVYHVDFSPLAADIRGRPRLAVLDTHDTDLQLAAYVSVRDSITSTSALVVSTEAAPSGPANRAFTVFIY